MTIGFLQTARLSATPLARHIDTPEKPAPQYASFEDAMRAMKDDARKIQQNSLKENFAGETRTERGSVIDYIRANPGVTANAIAKAFGVTPQNVRPKLSKLKQAGFLKVKKVRVQYKRSVAVHHHFYVTDLPDAEMPEPQKTKKPSPQRDKVIAFIRDNPGCTAKELADHMGQSHKSASAHINRARQVVNVRSVKAHSGAHVQARYYIDD